MTNPTDLFSSARRVGQLVWIESQVFELTGRWSATTPEPAARAFLTTASGHHGWHAELLSTLLPSVAGGPPADDFVAAAPAHLEELARLESITDTAARLAGVWRGLVPAIASAAEEHIAVSSGVADAASHRLLRLVIRDEMDDSAIAERLVAELAGLR